MSHHQSVLRPRRRGWLRPVAIGAALLALGGASVVVAPVASAHDELESAVPADGATLTAAPKGITLTFSDAVTQLGTAVVVTDPGAERVDTGKPRVDGVTVTQALEPLTVPGLYSVAFRVVSSDGHPITGTLTFTLALPAPSASPTPTPTPSATPSTSPSATVSESASPAASSSAGAADAGEPASSTSSTSGTSPLVWVAVGLLAAAAVFGAVAWRRRS